MEEQPVRPDLKQIVYECRDLFSRLSERNRALSQEWDDFAARLEARPDSPHRREERSLLSRDTASLPQAREFGDSLLSLHERFFETCRELLQMRLENDSLRKERASLQAELARFSEKVILLGRTQAEMTEQKAAYENQLKASKQILEETDRNLRRVESQLAERRGELDSLAGSLDRMTRERDAAQNARLSLESKISEVEASRASLGERVQMLEQRQDELRQQVGLLEEQLDRAKGRAEELEHELAVAQTRCHELEQTLDQVRQTTAPVEEFLSLKQGLLQVQEERVVQAQQEAYHIEIISRLEREAQEHRVSLKKAEDAYSQAESARTQLLEEVQKAQQTIHHLERELANLRETTSAVKVDHATPPSPDTATLGHFDPTLQPEVFAQALKTDLTKGPSARELDDSLPFTEFAVPPATPPVPEKTDEREGVSPPLPSTPESPPPPVEADLFGLEGRPLVVESLALQEDDRVFAELTGSLDTPRDLWKEAYPSETAPGASEDGPGSSKEQTDSSSSQGQEMGEMLDASEVLSEGGALTEVPVSSATENQEASLAEDPLNQTDLDRDISGPLFPDEGSSPETTAVGEPSVAEVLDRALARDAVESAAVNRVTPEREPVSATLSRIIDAAETQEHGSSEEMTLPEEDLETLPQAEALPVSPSIDAPVQAVPLPGEDPLIPPTPFQPSMDFPYPEITGARMERFAGKRVLLAGGDERFQSDYTHLFTMVHAELLYFSSILQLEKQGMKRHVRECDFVVVFGRAVNEPGILRLKQVAEEYSRPVFEHPSSGLVSLYHRLQRVNEEI